MDEGRVKPGCSEGRAQEAGGQVSAVVKHGDHCRFADSMPKYRDVRQQSGERAGGSGPALLEAHMSRSAPPARRRRWNAARPPPTPTPPTRLAASGK